MKNRLLNNILYNIRSITIDPFLLDKQTRSELYYYEKHGMSYQNLNYLRDNFAKNNLFVLNQFTIGEFIMKGLTISDIDAITSKLVKQNPIEKITDKNYFYFGDILKVMLNAKLNDFSDKVIENLAKYQHNISALESLYEYCANDIDNQKYNILQKYIEQYPEYVSDVITALNQGKDKNLIESILANGNDTIVSGCLKSTNIISEEIFRKRITEFEILESNIYDAASAGEVLLQSGSKMLTVQLINYQYPYLCNNDEVEYKNIPQLVIYDHEKNTVINQKEYFDNLWFMSDCDEITITLNEESNELESSELIRLNSELRFEIQDLITSKDQDFSQDNMFDIEQAEPSM